MFLYFQTFFLVLAVTIQVPGTLGAVVCPVIGEAGDYSYDSSSSKGPSNWGSLSDEFTTCGTGTSQSPIDFPTSYELSILARPVPVYSIATMTLHGKTENWALECETAEKCGELIYHGLSYKVVNIHFHTPSEHFVDGKQYPLECHIVHQEPETEQLVVLATMFEYAAGLLGNTGPNAVITTIMDKICANETTIEVPLAAILGTAEGILSYNGSLTTPPCTEGVTFFMQEKVQIVSETQRNNYAHTIGSPSGKNNRQTNNMNGRLITRFL